MNDHCDATNSSVLDREIEKATELHNLLEKQEARILEMIRQERSISKRSKMPD